MKAELRQANRDAAALKSANDVLRSRLDNRTEAVEAAKAAAAAAKGELSTAQADIHALERKLENKNAEIAALREQLAALPVAQARVETLQEERAALIGFTRDAKEEVQRLRSSDSEAAALRARLEASHSRHQQLEGELAHERANCADGQRCLEECKMQVQQLQEQLRHAEHTYDSARRLQVRMSEMQAELSAAQAATAAAQARQLDEAASASNSDAARAREERRWRRAEEELAAYRRLERALADAAGLQPGRPLWRAAGKGDEGGSTGPGSADGPTPTVIASAVDAVTRGLKEAAVADAVAATSGDHEAALHEAHAIAEAATVELEQVQVQLEHTRRELAAAQEWRAAMSSADAGVARATGLHPAASSGEPGRDAAAVATASGAGQHGRTCSACASGTASAAPHTCGCGPTSTTDILADSWWCTPPLPAAMPALALAMGAAARELAGARRTARMSQCELADVKADLLALEAEGEVAAVAATRSTRDARAALRAREAELAEARTAVQTGTDALAAAVRREDDLRSRVAALEASADAHGRTSNEWQVKLDESRGHCETLKAQLEDSKSQCDQLKAQLLEERDLTRRALKLAGQGGGGSDSEDELGSRAAVSSAVERYSQAAGGEMEYEQQGVEGVQGGHPDPRAVTWHAGNRRQSEQGRPTLVFRSAPQSRSHEATPAGSVASSRSAQERGGEGGAPIPRTRGGVAAGRTKGTPAHTGAQGHHGASSTTSAHSSTRSSAGGGGFWALSPPSPDRELSHTVSTLSGARTTGRSRHSMGDSPASHAVQTRSGARVIAGSSHSHRQDRHGNQVQGGYTSSEASDSGVHVGVLPPADIRQFVYNSAGRILGYVGRGEDAHSDGESHASRYSGRFQSQATLQETSGSSSGWEGQLGGGSAGPGRPPHHHSLRSSAGAGGRAVYVEVLDDSDESDDSDYVLPVKKRNGSRTRGRSSSRSRSGRRGRSRGSRSRASSGTRSHGRRSVNSTDHRVANGTGAGSTTVEQRLSGILKTVSRGGNNSLGKALGTVQPRSGSRRSARSSSRGSRSRSRSAGSRRGRFGRTAPAGSVRVSKRLTGETVASAARVLSTLVAPTSSPPQKASRGGRTGPIGKAAGSRKAPRGAAAAARAAKIKRLTKSAKL